MFFDGYNCIPGYQFNPMIWSICSPNPFHDLNLMWNNGIMKAQCDTLLYQSPTFSGAQGSFFPLMNYNYSSIPNMLAMQTFADFRNRMNQGCYGGIGANGQFRFNFPDFFNINNNSSNSSSATNTNTKEGRKIAIFKEIFEKLKEASEASNSPFLSDSLIDAYNEALKKKNNDEKIEALEAIFKKINPRRIQKVILEDEKTKLALYQAGYKVSVKNQTDWSTELNALYTKVKEGTKASKSDQITKVAGLINSHNNSDDNDILQVISTWNDVHKGSNEKGLLRFIAHHLPAQKEEQIPCVTIVVNIAKALTDKANEYEEYTQIVTKQKAVLDAQKKIETNFTKENILALATKADALYTELRLMEAQKIDKNLKEKYGFLNDIKPGVISEHMILEETKNDLKAEGFSISGVTPIKEEEEIEDEQVIDIDEIYENDAEGALAALVEGKEGGLTKPVIAKSKKDGVYETATTSPNANKHFYMESDGQIVELKGVKDITEDGSCTMNDGSTKALEDVAKVKISAQQIQDYKNTVDQIDSLIAAEDGAIVECKNLSPAFGNIRLYRSKLSLNKRDQYFMVRNNKLKEIDCTLIQTNAKVTLPNGTKVDFKDLTDANFKDFSHVTTQADVDAAKAKPKEDENFDLSKTGEMDELAEELGLQESILKGWYKKGGKFYKYNTETQQFEYQEGVSEVRTDGKVKKNGKWVSVREVDDPKNSGKVLRQQLRNSTDNYDIARKKLNSFSQYTDVDDIYNFLKGYSEERGGSGYNTKIAAQIATENGLSDEEKKKWLSVLAEKALVIARKAGMDSDSETCIKLRKIKDGEYCAGWSANFGALWHDKQVRNARQLDICIEEVMAAYEAKTYTAPEEEEDKKGVTA